MKTWVIPYIDQPSTFWQQIHDSYGEQIHSVYFPMPGKVVASGRGALADRYIEDFLRHSPLKKTVLINPVILNRPVEDFAPTILDALRRLREEFGVYHATISNLSLARQVKKALPDIKLSASTLMGISTPAQILMAREWIDTLIPDTRILRDLAALRKLRASFPGEIRLIVNEGCLPGCLYRTQHFYEMAYSEFFPQSLCRPVLVAHPWMRLTTGWILPQHLHHYSGLFDNLKLSGRVTLQDPNKYLRVLRAYIQSEKLLPNEIGAGPASVLDPIDISDSFFEHMLTCDKECAICTDCRDYYARSSAL